MSTFDPFAVQISCLVDGQLKILGSGMVIAPRVVLTASHVLKAPDSDLRVRPGATAEPVGVERRHLPDDGDIDVALLVVKDDLCKSTDALARLRARSLSNAEDWVASGYPSVVYEKPSQSLHSVAGKTLSTAVDAEECPVDVRCGPRCWAGLSGAAVRVGPDVVAVVRSVPDGWKDDRLLTTPVGRFMGASWFLNALGLGDAHRELQDEAAKLIEDIRAILDPCARLRHALRVPLGAGTDDAAELAGALVGGRADPVLRALRTAHNDLQKHENVLPMERNAIWSIVELVLPHAIDWNSTITQARQRVLTCRCLNEPEPREFELNLRFEAIAEIVLAGVYGGRCNFTPLLQGGRRLSGVGFLSWPAASAAPIRETPEHVREAIYQKLASELGVQGASVVERLSVFTEVPMSGDPKGILDEIEGRLKDAFEFPDEGPARRHLLVIDDDLGGPEAGLAAWQVVTTALGKRLESLRLVRLTGTATQRGLETSIVVPIEALFKARNQK